MILKMALLTRLVSSNRGIVGSWRSELISKMNAFGCYEHPLVACFVSAFNTHSAQVLRGF